MERNGKLLIKNNLFGEKIIKIKKLIDVYNLPIRFIIINYLIKNDCKKN